MHDKLLMTLESKYTTLDHNVFDLGLSFSNPPWIILCMRNFTNFNTTIINKEIN